MIAKRISTGLCMCSATALLGTMALLAQAPGNPGSMPQQPQQQQPPSATTPTNPGPGTVAPGQSMGDQAFLGKAIEGSKAEIQLGQLAEQKSQSADVKQFAQKMVADHSQMNDKWFDPIAKQLGVSEPKGPSKKDKKLIAKLQGLSGDEFDKEYITVMLKDHHDDLKDFKSEAEAAQDPNLKQVAQQGANIISQHLQLAEQVAKNHNVPVENNGKEISSK
jgi:putative membrane protein